MLNRITQFALLDIPKYWHTKRGLVVSLLLTMGVCLFLFNSIDLQKIDRFEGIVTLVSLVAVYFLWQSTQVKKALRGKVGIGIAIAREDGDQSDKLYKDFVIALRKEMKSAEISYKFQIIEYSNAVAKSLDNYDVRNEHAIKARLAFLLTGNTRIRDSMEGPVHIIDLDGLVKHVPINESNGSNFSKEFSDVLKNFRFLVEQNLAGCDFAGSHIAIVTKYIVGIAALFSNDFDYSEQLFLDCERTINASLVPNHSDIILLPLLERVKTQLKEMYTYRASILRNEYIRTNNYYLLGKIDTFISKAISYGASNNTVIFNKAICEFKLRHDVREVERLLDNKKDKKNPVWLLNRAFVYAYKEDLNNAYKFYVKAFELPIPDSTIIPQCEMFIQDEIDKNKENSHLYYCLGLINFKYKGDYISAKSDFLSFLKITDPKKFKPQKDIVQKWLEEIENSKSAA